MDEKELLLDSFKKVIRTVYIKAYNDGKADEKNKNACRYLPGNAEADAGNKLMQFAQKALGEMDTSVPVDREIPEGFVLITDIKPNDSNERMKILSNGRILVNFNGSFYEYLEKKDKTS